MKKSLSILLSSVLVTLLASCGGGGTSEESTYEFKPTLDRDYTGHLVVAGEYGSFEALEAEIKVFKKNYYPNVSIVYEKVDKYNQNIGTTLDREENRPNIFFSYTSYADNENMKGVMDHMENLSDPALNIDIDCLNPGLVKRAADNNVYMVPIFGRTYGMLVNDDLFKKENIKVPTTWTELLEVCDAFKAKDYPSPMMGFSKGDSNCFMNTFTYPAVVAELANNEGAIDLANSLDSSAGEYLRGALTKMKTLIDGNPIDIAECNKITDNYKQTLFRFYKGDVPMMICHADAYSGKKYEDQSEDYDGFKYSYIPIPVTDQGGYFIYSPSIEFSVNKYCENLDMTNEFMRFLITRDTLVDMAGIKRLLTPTKDVSKDIPYAPFHQVPKERTFLPELLGIKDQLATQIRLAAFKVGRGDLTVDQAVKQFGTLS